MLNRIERLAVSSLGIQTGTQNDTNWNPKKKSTLQKRIWLSSLARVEFPAANSSKQ